MRSSILRTSTLKPTSLSRAIPLFKMSTGVPSTTAPAQKAAQMSTNTSIPSESSLGIESTDIQTASGVELNPQQRIIIGSVLDLFKGKPTLQKLQLWTDSAKFNDPLTQAQGRKQYEAQWYGLKAAFSEIEQLHAQVTSSGNPITLDLKTRYKVKGLGMEKIIESVIKIYTNESGDRITQVEDRWNGNIPEGAFAKVFRNLNSVVVPAFVSVPKSDEEDVKKGH